MKRIFIISLAFNFLILLAFSNFSVQGQLFTRKLPKKWMRMDESQTGVEWFTSKTYKPGAKFKKQIFIDQGVSNPSQIFYSNASLTGLIKKLKDLVNDPESERIIIFIASYQATADCVQPPTFSNNEIVLIYALLDKRFKKRYFTIQGDNCYEISETCKNAWTKNYNDNINNKEGLLSTIDRTLDNYDLDKGIYSDTKSISYKCSDFLQFVHKERKYQLRKFNEAAGMVVNFASYSDKGNNTGKYKGRFILQFEFVKKDGTRYPEIYIDKQPNYRKRYKKTFGTYPDQLDTQEHKRKYQMKGYNHSELCPDDCPSGW